MRSTIKLLQKLPIHDAVSARMDSFSNITPSILSKLDTKLHLVKNHPLQILNSKIQSYFKSLNSNYKFLDSLDPIVSVKQNFDDLLFPVDHIGRSKTDTFYLSKDYLLRTHTSAHQSQVLSSRESDAYLLTADVYRRDEIDPTHYPVFHQMEGIRTFSDLNSKVEILPSSTIPIPPLGSNNPKQDCHTIQQVEFVGMHLRKSLEGLVRHLFRPDLEIRWIDAYFPFTSPSWEMEVLFNGKWLELCGCGIIQQEILNQNKNSEKVGWAFGLGLERIAMVLFGIPDIRLFWSLDERFTSQFKSGEIIQFVPFSKYPVCYKDVSFWCNESFHDNDFSDIVRQFAGDLVEKVSLIDRFERKGRVSKCYRIEYRSMERTLKNEEIDAIQDKIRNVVVKKLNVELR